MMWRVRGQSQYGTPVKKGWHKGFWAAIAAMVIAGTTVATSAHAQRQEEKRQESLLQYQEGQVVKAEQKAAQAETLATEQAKETMKKKKRSITQTVFTSPLGTMEEANIGTRSLLGGV